MTNLKKNYYDCLWEKYLSQSIKTFPKPKNCWYFIWLSQNSNITWEIVQANPDKPWNYEIFFINHIGKQKFIEEQRAVNVISDWFIELKTNPDSNLCKKWMKTVQSEFYNKNPWE